MELCCMALELSQQSTALNDKRNHAQEFRGRIHKAIAVFLKMITVTPSLCQSKYGSSHVVQSWNLTDAITRNKSL